MQSAAVAKTGDKDKGAISMTLLFGGVGLATEAAEPVNQGKKGKASVEQSVTRL